MFWKTSKDTGNSYRQLMHLRIYAITMDLLLKINYISMVVFKDWIPMVVFITWIWEPLNGIPLIMLTHKHIHWQEMIILVTMIHQHSQCSFLEVMWLEVNLMIFGNLILVHLNGSNLKKVSTKMNLTLKSRPLSNKDLAKG
jgi:hypothetical protein